MAGLTRNHFTPQPIPERSLEGRADFCLDGTCSSTAAALHVRWQTCTDSPRCRSSVESHYRHILRYTSWLEQQPGVSRSLEPHKY